MKLLLDSTVLIDALRRDRTRWEMLANLAAAEHQLASTAINLAEVYVGLRGREVEEFETLAGSIEWYSITPAIGRRGGLLRGEWLKRGRTIGLDDAIIAAVAIEHGLPLLTDNRKDFPMPELQLWPMPAAT